MGLLDILNGMMSGPRGQPSGASGSGGGMSPVTMALMGLLAYKAVKSFTGASAAAQPTADPASAGMASGGLGGIVGSLLGGGAAGGGLGGLLGGSSPGAVVSSGLGNLIKDFQNGGYGQAAQSWVGQGANQEIAPNDLAKAIGPDAINAIAQQTGMNRDDLLASLSQHLPELINQLTPNGRLPTEQEASRLV
ncbi:MAG TPA: YidB family protein [Stellaceae bacterium]|nr:YidB family protein [Stellaceae bacterium]